jgi:hypothetical protein
MSTENAVAALLREAEHAHGEYEVATLGGVRDEAWPVWYATYLLDHGLGDVLPGLGAAGEETLAARL